MGKKVILSVISDLVTDQRVSRSAQTFFKLGYEVILVGRQMKNSLPMDIRPYRIVRFKLPFEKGPWFYVTYNLRLFWFLLWNKTDLLWANDLDTLLPNCLVSWFYNKKLIYDSHEYFTGVPELESRPDIQRVWKKLENMLLPKISYMITVNDSIAGLYESEYGKKVIVVRNIPDYTPVAASVNADAFKELVGLPVEKKIVILQGSGINLDRGGEEAVLAMQFVENAILLIIGSGDVIFRLKEMSKAINLKDKIIFKDKMPFEQMMQYTLIADIGLTLDKDTNINYRFSLPNKLFDYIHAGIAVLATDLVEVRKIVEAYQVGVVLKHLSPESLSERINYMLSDEIRLVQWKTNARKAALELTWFNEEKKIVTLIDEVFR